MVGRVLLLQSSYSEPPAAWQLWEVQNLWKQHSSQLACGTKDWREAFKYRNTYCLQGAIPYFSHTLPCFPCLYMKQWALCPCRLHFCWWSDHKVGFDHPVLSMSTACSKSTTACHFCDSYPMPAWTSCTVSHLLGTSTCLCVRWRDAVAIWLDSQEKQIRYSRAEGWGCCGVCTATWLDKSVPCCSAVLWSCIGLA